MALPNPARRLHLAPETTDAPPYETTLAPHPDLHEVHCAGVHPRSGRRCGKLLMRLSGVAHIKCDRCGHVQFYDAL